MKRYMSVFALSALVLFVMSIICCVGCGGHAFQVPSQLSHMKGKLSNKELVAQTGGSTVALVFYNEKKETAKTTGYRPFCTGVWVDNNTILTADHCAKAMLEFENDKRTERNEQRHNPTGPMTLQQMLQRLFGGGATEEDEPMAEEVGLKIHYIQENEVMNVGEEPSGWHLAKVSAFDETHDLAILHAEGKAVPPHRVARLADENPEVGSPLHIVGHQTGLYWTHLNGNVAAYRDKMPIDEKGGPWLQANAPIFYGNSGGGAFNEYGELVGLADWIMRAPNVGFFVRLETIRSFLESNHILNNTSNSK